MLRIASRWRAVAIAMSTCRLASGTGDQCECSVIRDGSPSPSFPMKCLAAEAGNAFDRIRPPCYNPRHHTNCRAGSLRMRILAADIGFGYTKATDGRQFQVFKSIVGEANPIQFAEALLPTQAAQPRHFSIGGEDIFVGELAETQTRGRG